jgi:hypothetical protein
VNTYAGHDVVLMYVEPSTGWIQDLHQLLLSAGEEPTFFEF